MKKRTWFAIALLGLTAFVLSSCCLGPVCF